MEIDREKLMAFSRFLDLPLD